MNDGKTVGREAEVSGWWGWDGMRIPRDGEGIARHSESLV